MSSSEVVRQGGGGLVHVDVSSLVTLDLKDIENEPGSALVSRGAAYAREYARIEDKPAILAANIAVVMLALRKKHDDWLGQLGPYREDVKELYSQSGVQGDQLKRLKGNVRYHMGNLARRYLTARELRALGLDEASPLEKQRDRHATTAAILGAVAASSAASESAPAKPSKPAGKTTAKSKNAEPPTDQRRPGLVVRATADQLRLATVARGVIEQLDPEVALTDMTDGQRDALDAQLQQMESHLRRLRKQLKARSGA
ncbi:hypothetical protein ABTY96_03345 [Streptomyces sp. NPDC096057]|uniref:hypothetical protein n=1 Tax=Streptomyces sp. NPDC096057 TaxID=3155543 RepID=UPI003331AC61